VLPTITGEFRAVTDPELRFTPSGVAVANLRIAANSRKKVGEEWVDDKVVFLNLTCWKQQAENVAESVQKGDLIMVTGRLETREYETKDGEKRQSFDVTADQIGPSLAFATAKVSKTERRSGSTATPPPADPYGTPPQDDEPPF
jgi:single-strand DNA-binding protein